MSKYSKFITAGAGFVLAIGVRLFGGDSDEVFIIQAAITALTAIGVYAIPNAQPPAGP